MRWRPLPHVDVVDGLTIGELALTALLYAACAGAVLVAVTLLMHLIGAFTEGYRRDRP